MDLDGGATGYVLPDDVDSNEAPEPWVALLPALDADDDGLERPRLVPGSARTDALRSQRQRRADHLGRRADRRRLGEALERRDHRCDSSRTSGRRRRRRSTGRRLASTSGSAPPMSGRASRRLSRPSSRPSRPARPPGRSVRRRRDLTGGQGLVSSRRGQSLGSDGEGRERELADPRRPCRSGSRLCSTRRGSGHPACRPAPSIPTSGAGTRHSSRSAARGTTSHAPSRSSRRSSARSGRTGWCPTSSSTRRSRRTPTSRSGVLAVVDPIATRPARRRDVRDHAADHPRACGPRDAPPRA